MKNEPPIDIVTRIHEVIDDIEIIRAELSHTTSVKAGLAKSNVPIEQVRRLKYSTDQFRLFLWAYLDSFSSADANVNARLRQIRMNAAADMLRLLAKDFSTEGTSAKNESSLLGEQLRAMASFMCDLSLRPPS